jgi:hypothetical protein
MKQKRESRTEPIQIEKHWQPATGKKKKKNI